MMLTEARYKRQILHNSIYIEYTLIYNDIKQIKDQCFGGDRNVLCLERDGGCLGVFGCQNS